MSAPADRDRDREREAIVGALARRGYRVNSCAFVPDGPSRGWHLWWVPEPGRDGEPGMAHARDAHEAKTFVAALPFARHAKGARSA